MIDRYYFTFSWQAIFQLYSLSHVGKKIWQNDDPNGEYTELHRKTGRWLIL
jgi:hypothetical protein